MARNLRYYGDPVLRRKAAPAQAGPELAALVADLFDVMYREKGVGLAAPQVGVLQRVFVFRPDENGTKAVVNPVLTLDEGERETEEEGCLSLRDVRVEVERPTKAVLEGKDPNGDDVRYELEGFAARVVQHEFDHLDGVLIIDRTDAESRKRALGALRPRPILV